MLSGVLLVDVLPIASLGTGMLLLLVLLLWGLNGAGVHLKAGIVPRRQFLRAEVVVGDGQL